jgi:sec-independent protein translocase protein TatA
MLLPTALPLPAFFGGGIHWPEILLFLAIVLIIFGPKQLPKIGRALGGGIKEFKDGLKTGVDDEEEEEAKTKSSTTVEAGPAEPLPPGQPTNAQSSEQRERSEKS